ncbi:hypothetical protein FNF29_05163 [Cafeteria roenbergensis]|uniref:Coatomer subunit gamma n=1 Tax=Cafeteria roenbergensis TaxID=33653 RepID=A0A5A8CCI1_CAFRO|nr:hypothetical protein FNF29_05163 [Cafeteria roenbergensis]|eukprot:KAA0150588.1 hypothetical protein FNF29_05163 [Cafeteria roenbergensis]
MSAAAGGISGAIIHEIRGHDGEIEDVNPFQGLDTATVLQKCRAFHDPVMVNKHPRKCCEILTQLLYLMAQGFKLSSSDTAGVFFGVTKLFSSDNLNLRRLVYLFLKEVAETSNPADIIIVVQSLIKDFNETSHEILQANALRVLTRIVDASTLSGLERYYREAIVDSSPIVATAGLSSGLFLLRDPGTTDIVRRWVGEIQTGVTSADALVRFHALCLLHSLKARDNLGVSRLLTAQISKTDFSSALAVTVLVRYTSGLLRRDIGAIDPRVAYDFLDSCTRCASDIVKIEAARAICNLPSVAASDIRPAIAVLHRGLTAKSATRRFASVRTLAQVAQLYPTEVEVANTELEGMLGDSRIIATYAIVTLLKTGSASSVSKLLKHIHTFLADLSDEFKVVIARAVHDLALRFTSSYDAILPFVSSALREEGSFEFKRALVDVKVDLMERVPECAPSVLSHLCEFIEDCEFTPLCTRVLHLLGDVGPTSEHPEALIRFVYNRLLLEAAPVRAAAISTLAKFGAAVPALRSSVLTLLHRVRHDDDDEVRDRCALAITLLSDTDTDGESPATPADLNVDNEDGPAAPASAAARTLAVGSLPMPISSLQKALRLYQLHPTAGAFSFDDLPAVEGATGAGVTYADTARSVAEVAKAEAQAREEAKQAGAAASRRSHRAAGAGAAAAGAGGSAGAAGAAGSDADAGLGGLMAVPELAAAGKLFRTTAPARLTEEECEYTVTCRRHVFESHVVMDFEVTNTINVQQLERVTVQLEPQGDAADAWEVEAEVAAPVARFGEPVHTYVSLRRAGDPSAIKAATFLTTLRFFPVPVDASTGEVQGEASYDEEFEVDAATISPADFVVPRAVSGFRTAWEAAPEASTAQVQLSLPFATVAEAASRLIGKLGLAPCDNSGAVKSTAERAQVLLSGVALGGSQVLVRLQILQHPTRGLVMRAMARSDADDALAGLILGAIDV